MVRPFPGMDPFLESPAVWSDFHAKFIAYWCEALLVALPDHYDARIGERVYLVEQPPPTRKLVYPDVAVAHLREPGSSATRAQAGVATLEPVLNALVIGEGARETYLEIVHRPDQTLITVMEVLSPANKEDPGRTQYLAKRDALAGQIVHLVELDLLVGGQRLPLRDPLPPAHYYALVSRADRRPSCEVYPWTVRERLPVLPIPLKAPDPDLRIDLEDVFNTTLERGGFPRRLRYDIPVPVKLPANDMTWIRDRIQGAHS